MGNGYYLLDAFREYTFSFQKTTYMRRELMFQQAIDKIIPIRLHSYEELLGADYFEHDIRHPSVGVSRLQNIFIKLDLYSKYQICS